MTRRQGIIAALAALVGIQTGRAKAEPTLKMEGNGASASINFPRGALSFNIDSFTEYRFSMNGETITLKPSEVMDALRG